MLGTALLAVAALAAAILIITNMPDTQVKPVINTPLPTSKPTKIPTITKKPVVTNTMTSQSNASLKTYVNNDWHFAIDYPANANFDAASLKPSDGFLSSNIVQILDQPVAGQVVSERFDKDTAFFQVGINRQPITYQGKIYAEQDVLKLAPELYSGEESTPKITPQSVSGHPAFLAHVPPSEDGTPATDELVTIHNGVIYTVTASRAFVWPTQVLKSFRFID